MRTISRGPLVDGERVIGQYVCTYCQSELELQLKDFQIGTDDDEPFDYLMFTCHECTIVNVPVNKSLFDQVKRYRDIIRMKELAETQTD